MPAWVSSRGDIQTIGGRAIPMILPVAGKASRPGHANRFVSVFAIRGSDGAPASCPPNSSALGKSGIEWKRTQWRSSDSNRGYSRDRPRPTRVGGGCSTSPTGELQKTQQRREQARAVFPKRVCIAAPSLPRDRPLFMTGVGGEAWRSFLEGNPSRSTRSLLRCSSPSEHRRKGSRRAAVRERPGYPSKEGLLDRISPYTARPSMVRRKQIGR